MRGVLICLGVCFIGVACSAPAGLQVDEAVVAVPAGPVTAAYFVLTNHEADSDRLVGVRSEAGDAELHRSFADGDRMSMEPIAEMIVGGGEVIRFAPGGLHVMMFGVGALERGQVVSITLVFESYGDLEFEARVVPYSEIEP